MNEMIILGRITPLHNDKHHQKQEIYSINGIMATLKSTDYKEPPKILIGVRDDRSAEAIN